MLKTWMKESDWIGENIVEGIFHHEMEVYKLCVKYLSRLKTRLGVRNNYRLFVLGLNGSGCWRGIKVSVFLIINWTKRLYFILFINNRLLWAFITRLWSRT